MIKYAVLEVLKGIWTSKHHLDSNKLKTFLVRIYEQWNFVTPWIISFWDIEHVVFSSNFQLNFVTLHSWENTLNFYPTKTQEYINQCAHMRKKCIKVKDYHGGLCTIALWKSKVGSILFPTYIKNECSMN